MNDGDPTRDRRGRANKAAAVVPATQPAAPDPVAQREVSARAAAAPVPERGAAMPPQQMPQTGGIATEADAAAVLIEMGRLMSALSEVIEQETTLVRAGRLYSASRLSERKIELARAFINQAQRVRAGARYLARTTPKTLEALCRQHQQFSSKLAANLTVLQTARSVSESILRGVSSELARRSVPKTYSASGRQSGTGKIAPPIALSRML